MIFADKSGRQEVATSSRVLAMLAGTILCICACLDAQHGFPCLGLAEAWHYATASSPRSLGKGPYIPLGTPLRDPTNPLYPLKSLARNPYRSAMQVQDLRAAAAQPKPRRLERNKVPQCLGLRVLG